MKENFLHFLSETPSIISINGQQVGKIDNKDCLELDVITKTKQIYVSYSPISEKIYALPYTVQIDTSNTPTTSNENFKIIPFPNDNYDIIMSPFFYYKTMQTNVLFNKPIDKFFISITTENNTKVIIYSGVTIVFSINIPLIKAAKVDEFKGLIIIEGIIDENTYYVLIIETSDFKIIYNDLAMSIENNNDKLSIYKSLNTMCQHGLVVSLDLTDKTTEEFYVFENELPYTNFNNLLIPHAFLECVKIGDEKTAKLFMSDNFNSTSIKQLKDYFGDFSHIYLNRHDSSEFKCNYTIKSNKWRNYNFLIDNNRIYDIEEIF